MHESIEVNILPSQVLKITLRREIWFLFKVSKILHLKRALFMYSIQYTFGTTSKYDILIIYRKILPYISNLFNNNESEGWSIG